VFTLILLTINCRKIIAQTEVFSKRSIPSKSSTKFNSAWEVVYGPNDSLWVTENAGYKVSRVSLGTTTSIKTLLDLSTSTNFLGSGQQPQGGLMGLAIHPNLYSSDPAVRAAKPWVYVAYVYNRGSCPGTNTSCVFTTKVVRYDYSGDQLSNPTIVLDNIPGSSDHNSGRLVIGPVQESDGVSGHTAQYRLYYTVGDMGAGQFLNTTRTENAQNVDVLEGKSLRLNTESDGDAGLDAWVPNDNPNFNSADGITAQDYVFTMGHRNPQGLAWGNVNGTNRLYSSEQMDRADDEINILQAGHNYGWDKVSGWCDGDVNGNQIGQTTITDEAANCGMITNMTEPIKTMFHTNSTWSTYPTSGSSNGQWPTIAVSSIEFYSQNIIPGWKNSLLVTPLKESRVYRLKLNTSGDQVSGDTISYFNGDGNRVRRVRMSPDGKKIYVARDQGSDVTNSKGKIIEYTFLGYSNDAQNKSTIPSTVDVSTTSTYNTCLSGTTITIDNTNNNLWVPITGPDGNILAEIYPNGNNLGTVTTSFYIHSGSIRNDPSGRRYLDRNLTITPSVQPSSTVKIRLYMTNAEYDALKANANSGVNSLSDLLIRKNSDPCGGSLTNATTNITPTVAEAHGTGGYVLQGDITSFSSFYIGSNLVTLPVKLLYFKGAYQKDGAYLQWETSNETNTSNFIVERSTDGRSFRQIGTVAAAGNTIVNMKYNYTDYEAAMQSSTIVYYRLKMVDKDGAYSYSDIINLTIPAVAGKMTVFPNPANDEVTVTVAAPQDGRLQWKLMDNTGRIVMQQTAQLKKGNNSFSVSINKLSAGLYYLTATGAGIDQQVKLQKL
jgi:PQQ-dependent dehydrogenase (s-GDH family)